MSEKAKMILGIVLGVLGAVALFCLIVIIGCSVNGLTFSEQVVEWFSHAPATVPEIPETPIA